MGSSFSIINRLLPFATPGTPLVQDLVHLAAICGVLYLAPQIQQWMQIKTQNPRDTHHSSPQPVGGRHDRVPEAREDAELETIPMDVLGQELPNQDVEIHLPETDREPGDDAVQLAQPAPAQPGRVPAQRNVGVKKAKSLARRDQRRAYHEFQRAQGDAQRTRDAEGAAEREAALAAEKERRKAAEAALEARKTKEREQKREQERRDREEEIRRRELTVQIVKGELNSQRMCNLFEVARRMGDDVDEEWIEKILTASGMIGMKGGVMTMITSMGWVVCLRSEDMNAVYTGVLQEQNGCNESIDFEALGARLESYLRQQAQRDSIGSSS